jgi:DNA-binding Xre family transcriptional regulator
MLDITDKKYFSWKITERFLFIMDRILGNRANGKVTAKMFGEIVGIASSNLNRIRQNPTENFVTIEAIGRLCNHYKVSPAWIVLDIGNPYADEHIYNAYQALEKRMNELEDSVRQIEVSLNLKPMRAKK